MDLLARLVAIAIASMASAPPAPVCTSHWSADVMGELDRCMDGEGDGCAAIGRDYEASCDAYSSIKWFSRGCMLGSAKACDALKRAEDHELMVSRGGWKATRDSETKPAGPAPFSSQ